MRTLLATTLAGLLSSPSVAAAGPDLLLLPGVGVQEKAPTRRPFAPEALRKEVRSASREARMETAVQQPPPKNKSWMERHPVWFGLIVGAGAGAALGAASCSDGCFPIGAGGAAMVGSWYGAGAGALIGWGIGRAK